MEFASPSFFYVVQFLQRLQYWYSTHIAEEPVVARPGAFAANFTPEVLDRFRDLCKKQEGIHKGSAVACRVSGN